MTLYRQLRSASCQLCPIHVENLVDNVGNNLASPRHSWPADHWSNFRQMQQGFIALSSAPDSHFKRPMAISVMQPRR